MGKFVTKTSELYYYISNDDNLNVKKVINEGADIHDENDFPFVLLIKNNNLELLRKMSRDDFKEKYGVVSRLMKQETTLHITSDDIYTITKKAPSLLKKR